MKKILFVCLGNICRSPMAEMIFKHLVKENNLEADFEVSSAGISNEEAGNDIYHPARRKLLEKGVSVENRRARKMNSNDIEYYDKIVVMEKYQQDVILSYCDEEKAQKVKCLRETDIDDPWYSGDFETAYQEIYDGCEELFRQLTEQKSYEE